MEKVKDYGCSKTLLILYSSTVSLIQSLTSVTYAGSNANWGFVFVSKNQVSVSKNQVFVSKNQVCVSKNQVLRFKESSLRFKESRLCFKESSSRFKESSRRKIVVSSIVHRRKQKQILKARPNDKCWTTQHVGWTNILSFGHRVWWPLNMLDDVGTCLMQYQTFDPTSFNISFVLMLDAWNFVRLAGLSNMLHARTRIRTANSAVTIDTVCSRQCSLKVGNFSINDGNGNDNAIN